eukprot:227243-Chlamydomonas_euryale.AAC.10
MPLRRRAAAPPQHHPPRHHATAPPTFAAAGALSGALAPSNVAMLKPPLPGLVSFRWPMDTPSTKSRVGLNLIVSATRGSGRESLRCGTDMAYAQPWRCADTAPAQAMTDAHVSAYPTYAEMGSGSGSCIRNRPKLCSGGVPRSPELQLVTRHRLRECVGRGAASRKRKTLLLLQRAQQRDRHALIRFKRKSAASYEYTPAQNPRGRVMALVRHHHGERGDGAIV